MAIERVIDLRTGGVTERAYTPSPAPIPQSVTPRQARLALLAAGKLSAAQAAITAAGEAAVTEWEYATEFRKDHPLVASIGAQLGLDLDALFRDAATR